MDPSLSWLLVAGPLALVAAGLVPGAVADRHATLLLRFVRIAAGLSCAGAVAGLVLVWSRGSLTTGTVGIDGIGFSLQLDTLSGTVAALVSLIGAVVVRYSRHYLDGDPRQGRFTGGLAFTLGAVLLLILGGNLLQVAVAGVATSVGLGRLLRFYGERRAAVLAARKKFVVSRLGDVCLFAAVACAWQVAGTLDHVALSAAARTGSLDASALTPVAILLALAAVLKSAQFPLHGWLLEVMETPTPVSALLHAGVINAGGYLVLRYADLLAPVPAAGALLVIVGGFTALYGSWVMLTQTSVKLALAWSTIAQMGFLLLECGLGAWAAALLHLVAHSLYKAHAFLSSGSVLDLARASWSPSPGGPPHPARLALALPLALGVTVAVALPFGMLPVHEPGAFALAAVMAMGVTHLLANAIDSRPNGYVLVRTLAAAGAVVVAWFALHAVSERLLAGVVPSRDGPASAADLALVALVITSFALLTLFQGALPRAPRSARVQAWYVHAANGFYVNTIANRLVLRFWPLRGGPR